jgi:hypothetical protein
MNKSYVLVFNTAYKSQKELTEILDKCRTVITWRYDLTNAIYIISANTAFEIAVEIERFVGVNNGRYIILEYNGNSQGRLTEESWYFLNEKHVKPTT